jgi:hypothetical protein
MPNQDPFPGDDDTGARIGSFPEHTIESDELRFISDDG